jgi:hypothetical protein
MKKNKNRYVNFDGMCWPLPNNQLEYILRYGNDENILNNKLVIASIINSYNSLFLKTQKRRNYIIKKIKEKINNNV